MPVPPVWDETVQTRYSEGDFYRKWKLSSLFMALPEAAANHALHFGLGYDELAPQNLAWILSRVKMRFNSFPTAGERVIIRTWPKGIQQKLFFLRDFLILDARGELVHAAASSAWLLINKTTRQIFKPAALTAGLPDNSTVSPAIDEPLERITTRDGLQEQFTVQARASMLDLMGHVTSARYLEWVADCFPYQAFQEDALAWLQINFNREVKPGERVAVFSGQTVDDPNTWIVQGANLDSGNNAFDAALGFRQTQADSFS
jgi:medium-chain acyl-[acyl-carrier-protein] hydrolase